MTGRSSIGAAMGLTSLLFVPGSTPARFAKALGSDADLICIDLEDAVASESKAAARAAAIGAIGPRVAIRINGVTTDDGMVDLHALAAAPGLPDLVLLPKVESADEIAIARRHLPDAAFVPLIETARGLRLAHHIGQAPGVVAMMFGGGDLSGELGVALAWEPLAVARGLFILACAEAGVPAIDVPWIVLDDATGLADEARRAHAIGFQAKAAIHPAQLEAIHAAMRPSADLVEEARAALAAYEAAGARAIRYQGRMLEAPIIRRYARIINMAKARELT
ncbi:MAG: CoA ester lyase [Sphingomonas sp. 28-62-20]|nr:MAG: CoA ester lyase [Sphingomonas sp. 28-62-20]